MEEIKIYFLGILASRLEDLPPPAEINLLKRLTNPLSVYNIGELSIGGIMPENRDKHIGLLVEPSMCRKLKKIADEKYMTLSTYIYSILKEHLKRKENDPRG